MENNDSPKAINISEDSEETMEEPITTTSITSTEKKKKKNKHKKKKKNSKKTPKNSINLKFNNKNGFSDNLLYYNNKPRYYRFVGRTIFLFMDKYDNPLLIIGPHWPLFACFFSCINILYLIVIFNLWSRFGFKSKIINQVSYWLYNLSYSYTSLINPGYPKNNYGRRTGNPRDEYYFCSECKFYIKRNSGAQHCDDCGICIEGLDHHCPWTSHCVGKNNIITFYIFIVSTLFSICYLPLAFCYFLK